MNFKEEQSEMEINLRENEHNEIVSNQPKLIKEVTELTPKSPAHHQIFSMISKRIGLQFVSLFILSFVDLIFFCKFYSFC